MKKKLLALAVAGAFAAPVAAMADTTIYGVANMSYDMTNTNTTTASTSQNKVSSNSSRIGFKGTEDLGGGTNAIWQIESQVNMDGTSNNATCTSANGGCSNNTLGTRNTFAGLSGESWGTVLLGKNDTPYKASTRRLDLFADGIADNRSLMGAPSVAANWALFTSATTTAALIAAAKGVSSGVGFDTRPGDVVQYNSPNMSGVTVSAQYVAGAETPTPGTKGKAYSLAGAYEAGPIYAALAYQSNNIGAAGSGTMAGVTGVVDNKESAWKLGGSYTMDQFAVNIVYEHTSDDFGKSLGFADNNILGHHTWYLGGKFNVSSNDAIKLAYTKMGEINGAGITAVKDKSGAKQVSIGYDHAMSKRTTVYALYTKLNNDTAAAFSLSNATAVSTGAVTGLSLDADPSAFSLGIKHTF